MSIASRGTARRPSIDMRYCLAAFTIAELLISIGVLVLVVLLATQLLNSAASITTLGHKQMDTDSQARQLLDRMSVDFAQMVKRSDVDYYLKSSATPPPTGVRNLLQPGNDKIAFYSTVPGYYPTAGLQSPVSLVAYRVNSQNKLERMGKGLVWNAVSTTDTPVVFMPIPLASPLPVAERSPPDGTPTPSPSPAWSEVASTGSWSDSEVIGSQVFRFEYFYLLKGGLNPSGGTAYAAILSDTPWDTRICACPTPNPPTVTPTPGTPTPAPTPPLQCCHTAPEGMQDVAAIVVVIAVMDSKSKVLATDAQIGTLASGLIDWGTTSCPGCPTQNQWQSTPGLLLSRWRSTVDANAIGLPRPVLSGVRMYERRFYLSPPTLLTP